MRNITESKRTSLLWGLILFGLYGLLAVLVHNRVFANIDFSATRLLQRIIPRTADWPSSVLSLLGSAEISVLIFAALVFRSSRGTKVRLVLFFSLVAFLEVQGKTMIHQPGPSDELSRYVFAFGMPTGILSTPFSYPSGHAARMGFLAVLAVALIAPGAGQPLAKRILTAFVLILAAAMLISRVYIGDHWMTDVVGGALIGVGSALFSIENTVAFGRKP